jgi:hypothetical protein
MKPALFDEGLTALNGKTADKTEANRCDRA